MSSDSDDEWEPSTSDKSLRTSATKEVRVHAVSDSSDPESNEETSHTPGTVPIWSQSYIPIWCQSYRVSPPLSFMRQTGVPQRIQDLEVNTPFEVFRILWRDSFTESLAFQTNLYAQQENKPYKPTTAKELHTFLGINLLMGIKRTLSYRDHWSSAPDLHDPFISNLITVNRFGWLLSHLHINDNNLQPDRKDPYFDKLYKVRPLVNELSATFAASYLPTEFLAIDESMIKFKGRSSLKQYMPKKPVKRGYKVWMLCASNGYNLKFDIYTGKSDNGVQRELGARVVKSLTEDCAGRHHRVFFDNYFTSYPLLKELRDATIYACGTVNANRKHLLPLQADKKMERDRKSVV